MHIYAPVQTEKFSLIFMVWKHVEDIIWQDRLANHGNLPCIWDQVQCANPLLYIMEKIKSVRAVDITNKYACVLILK